MTKIQATGTSEAHYRAERATVLARISITSRDRSESIRQATHLHNLVTARAQQLRNSGDATWHAANPISTWTNKSYAEGSKSKVIIEHHTSSQVRVKLANLELVSELITEFAEAGVETSVDWALTVDSRRTHERSARKDAVREAREIAEDYADALGERVVRVVSISDDYQQVSYSKRGVRAMSAAMGETAEVTVPEITVSATVTGEFESA